MTKKLTKPLIISVIVPLSFLVTFGSIISQETNSVANAQDFDSLHSVPCSSKAYYIQSVGSNPSDISYLDLSSSDAQIQTIGPIKDITNNRGYLINGAGYNSADGFFYGVAPSNTSTAYQGTLFRFDDQGNAENMGQVLPIMSNQSSYSYIAGDVRGEGIPGSDNLLYVLLRNTNYIYKIDINTPGLSPSQRLIGRINTNTPLVIADVAFSPTDGKLYGFDRWNGNARFVRIDPSTGEVEVLSNYLGNLDGKPHGASWFSGTTYYSYKNSGLIYRIPSMPSYSSTNKIPEPSVWKDAPETQANDAVVCSAAPTEPVCIGQDGTEWPLDDEHCSTMPYLRVYGNDVLAGAGFGENCTLSNEPRIESWAKDLSGTGLWAGAGTQFAASSRDEISGFISSMLRNNSTSDPKPHIGLSFGNTTNTGKISLGSSQFGGFSGITHCVPDYYNNVDLLSQSDAQVKKFNIDHTMNASDYSFSGKTIVLVNGDVTINSDINLNNNPTSVSNIPSLYVIAKGNINIHNSVDRLDGVYIAQPEEDNSKGEINTCYNSGGNAKSVCNRQLLINGAFIAKYVHFRRTNGSLDSLPPNAHIEPSTSNNIAEVFNFGPSEYLAPLNSSLVKTGPYQSYDYIVSLPPIL